MTTPADQSASPVPPAAPTALPVKPVAKPMPVPMKGWRNYSGNDQQKFKPVRSPATRFIQARRAPGK